MRATSALPATVTPAGQRLLDQMYRLLFPRQPRHCCGVGSKAIMEAVYCSSFRQVRQLHMGATGHALAALISQTGTVG